MFEEANKKALEEYRRKEKANNNFAMFYAIAGLIAAIMICRISLGPFQPDIMYVEAWRIGIVVALIIFWVSIYGIKVKVTERFIKSQSDLEVKAKEFATTIFLDDLYTILASLGDLHPEFKNRLQNIMTTDYVWFKDGQLDCSGFELNDVQEKDFFSFEMKDCKYCFTGLNYIEGEPFKFTFDTVSPDGKIEKIPMCLPAKKMNDFSEALL
ncbi:MAG: hypothetical protein ACD_80C00118G0017 [uncultured bacterium (gcode 4)]|uniref:Uncharacterized protein n=1 Tax=uncultured bacterium (gcode 4) TaxID=1234023 RepID=K1XXM9_9BACT|nr:MAG: hypothetical protein ACD_80C00118G0017 [uncultured bacterium (gcode 4)]